MTDEVKPNYITGFDRQDRDLLIRLNTRVEDLIVSLEKKDNLLAQDIGGLKQGKLDKSEFTTHCANDTKDFERIDKSVRSQERDIKNLNRYLWFGLGVVAVIQFLAPFIMDKFFK